MTIKEKLQTIKYKNELEMSIKYCGILWNILPTDNFIIYENDEDYLKNNPLIFCNFKDIKTINQRYLNLEFDFFALEKPNSILNKLNVYFILHKLPQIERGIKNRIEYR